MMSWERNAALDVVLSSVLPVCLFLGGVMLTAQLCLAAPSKQEPVPSILDPRSTPADAIHHLSLLVSRRPFRKPDGPVPRRRDRESWQPLAA